MKNAHSRAAIRAQLFPVARRAFDRSGSLTSYGDQYFRDASRRIKSTWWRSVRRAVLTTLVVAVLFGCLAAYTSNVMGPYGTQDRDETIAVWVFIAAVVVIWVWRWTLPAANATKTGAFRRLENVRGGMRRVAMLNDVRYERELAAVRRNEMVTSAVKRIGGAAAGLFFDLPWDDFNSGGN